MSDEYSLSGKLTPPQITSKKQPVKHLLKKKKPRVENDEAGDLPGDLGRGVSRIFATMEMVDGEEYIVVRMPVIKNTKPSKSGKSVLVGNTRGRRRVYTIVDGKRVPFTVHGAHVCAIATAYVPMREVTTSVAGTENAPAKKDDING
jgi:hypothetical protein